MPSDLILQTQTIQATIVLAGEIVGQVDALEARLGALPPVTDQESLNAVREVMNTAGAIARAVDAQRANAKAPWAAMAKHIDAIAKPIVDRLMHCVADSKTQIAAFAAEQDRIRIAALRAQQVAQAAAAESLRQGQAPQLQVTLQPETFTMPTRVDKRLKITDPSKIPSQYWVLDERKVEAHLRDGIAVPGAELITVTTIVNR
jgi:hypothetical protein